MNLTAIITVLIMYICFGIFTWQFWLLTIVGALKDVEKILQLSKIPLILFLLFWPLSILLILKIMLFDKK